MSGEVTWQSAYWALVPIAINTMTQPSGKVLNLPSGCGFSLRSSPFICACDTLFIIAAFIHQTIGHGSPRIAARVIIEERFSDATVESESGSFAQFQRNTVVRLVLFILSTLLGIVKLYGMQGVPWTKAWASMFWSSFLVLEIVGFLAGKDWCDRTATRNVQNPGLPAHSILPYQSGAPLHFGRLQPYVQDLQSENNSWLITGILVASASIFIHLIPFHHTMFKELAEVPRPDPNVEYLAEYMFSLFDIRAPACFWCLLAWLCFVPIPAKALKLSGPSLLRFLEMPKPRLAMRVLRGAFIMVNLIGGIRSYRILFNPEGTVKPSWTELLG